MRVYILKFLSSLTLLLGTMPLSSMAGELCPNAPTNVSVSFGTNFNYVDISWSWSGNPNFIEIQRNDGQYWEVIAHHISGNRYFDTTANPGQAYYYRVNCSATAYDYAIGQSVQGFRGIPAPSGVNASDGTYTDKVRVTWNGVSGAIGYDIFSNSCGTSGGSPIQETFVDIFPSPGVSSQYYVRAVGDTSPYRTYSACSSPDSGYRAMSPPASLNVQPLGNSLRLTWQTSQGASFYRIYRSTTSNACGSYFSEVTAPNSTFTDSSAIPGTTYYYSIRSVGQNYTQSACSTEVSGTIPIGAPSNFQASDGTYSDRVAVTWSPPLGAVGYAIYRALSPSNCVGAPVIVPAVNYYNDFSAEVGVTYYYSIRARGANNEYGPCLSGESGYRTLVASAISASDGEFFDKIRIQWNEVPGAVNGYNIYRSTSTDSAACGGSPFRSNYQGTSLDDTSASALIYYYYSVRPVYHDYTLGPCSNRDSGYKALPLSLHASQGVSTEYVSLDIGNPGGYIQLEYDIYRSTTNSPCSASDLIAHISQLSLIDLTALPGENYYYSVRSRDLAGALHPCSETTIGYRAMRPPNNVQASDRTSTDFIRVQWESVPEATGYALYRSGLQDPIILGANSDDGLEVYIDCYVTPGQLYTYSLKSIGSNESMSAMSSSDTGVRELSIPQLSASDGNSSSYVRIELVSPGASSFDIYRSRFPHACEGQPLAFTQSTSYYDHNVDRGELYYYSAVARTQHSVSQCSSVDSGFAGVNLSGRVKLQDGTPLNGVTISDGVRSFVNNYNGNWAYFFKNGSYSLTATKSNYIIRPKNFSNPVTVSGTDIANLDFEALVDESSSFSSSSSSIGSSDSSSNSFESSSAPNSGAGSSGSNVNPPGCAAFDIEELSGQLSLTLEEFQASVLETIKKKSKRGLRASAKNKIIAKLLSKCEEELRAACDNVIFALEQLGAKVFMCPAISNCVQFETAEIGKLIHSDLKTIERISRKRMKQIAKIAALDPALRQRALKAIKQRSKLNQTRVREILNKLPPLISRCGL